MKGKKIVVLIGAVVLIAAAVIGIMLFVTNKGHRVIKVESFSGKVALKRDDSEKDIFANMNLKTQDVVTTGEDGLIGLLVDDDKNIAATENTCFAIVSKGNAQKGALKIELKYGTSLIKIKNKLSDGSSFEVETPNASLSVKGTTFEVTYTPETQTTVLKVTEGSVQVGTKAKTDMVNAGKTAVIKDDDIKVSEFVSDDSSNNNDNNVNNGSEDKNNDSTTSSGVVLDEDFPKLLKGGLDSNQLIYLLKVVSRSKYMYEEDYLKNSLYWLSDKDNSEKPIEPMEKLEDGSVVYDVVALNKLFSFITDDTISEENLNPGLNRLDGDRLICTPSPMGINKIASTAIYRSYYSESNEIIVEYQFNVVDIDTFDVQRFQKKAHLIPAEQGKYTFGYIE